MGEAERMLLAAVARAVLVGDRGGLSAQLDHAYAQWPDPEPADLEPSRTPDPEATSPRSVDVPPFVLGNGLGGFTDDGRSYAIVLDGAAQTPLPWANVTRIHLRRYHRVGSASPGRPTAARTA
jgi:cyclic beta-1,2-glucan synthetase